MGVFSLVRGIISPVAELLGKVVTKEEDILKTKELLFRLETEFASRLVSYETKLLEAKSRIIIADAQGASWLQRNWRPLMMLTFLALVVADTFDLVPVHLAQDCWTLMKIGLGGHLAGDVVERLAPHISKNKRGP